MQFSHISIPSPHKANHEISQLTSNLELDEPAIICAALDSVNERNSTNHLLGVAEVKAGHSDSTTKGEKSQSLPGLNLHSGPRPRSVLAVDNFFQSTCISFWQKRFACRVSSLSTHRS